MLSRVDAFADVVAVKQVGFETFRLCQQLVDGVVLVDNGAISSAIKDVFNETRSILEPAGAVGVAGALAWLKHNGYEGKTVFAITSGANMSFDRLRLFSKTSLGKTVVAVTSGANMNFDRLRLVADLANVGATTEATLATCIPEEPESFRRFINTVVAAVQVEERGVGINITEFKYRFNAGESAQVLWGAGIQDSAQLASLIKELNSANMPTVDVSKMEAAQLHLRHLVGGRARCAVAGTLLGEHIFQVIFPENPGALNEFVTALCPWNVTLFHYRTTGNRESSVLLGIQIPDGQEALFAEQVTKLSNFTFKDLAADEQAIFARFLQ
ncbi:hypothetical protein FOA52_008384 [Chlamydomonas sp. UWO 241]|nr:hypothetical protein FOA52_008384 [Chlamydomonas sp. UWO 241]